jgi:hypothetical protein
MIRKPSEPEDEKHGINRRPAGQPDPDANRAKFCPEGKPVSRSESDQPVTDRGKQ